MIQEVSKESLRGRYPYNLSVTTPVLLHGYRVDAPYKTRSNHGADTEQLRRSTGYGLVQSPFVNEPQLLWEARREANIPDLMNCEKYAENATARIDRQKAVL